MFEPIFLSAQKLQKQLIFRNEVFQSTPFSRKRPCATLARVSVLRMGGRGLEYAPPWGSVARPGVSASGSVRVKVSMKWRFLDELKPRHTVPPGVGVLTSGGRAPMVCGVPSGSGADGAAWSAPDRVAVVSSVGVCLSSFLSSDCVRYGVRSSFLLLLFLLEVPEDGRRLPSLQGVRFLVLFIRAYYIIIR